jgi:hypothetical protein
MRVCEALGVSRGDFHAWLRRPPSQRDRSDEEIGARVGELNGLPELRLPKKSSEH